MKVLKDSNIQHYEIPSSIALVGAGNMGMALLRSLLNQDAIARKEVSVITSKSIGEVSGEREFLVPVVCYQRATKAALDAVHRANVVVLMMKPQQFFPYVDQLNELNQGVKLNPVIDSDAVVCSIMAGMRVFTIAEKFNLPVSRIARVMHNVAASIGASAGVMYWPPEMTPMRQEWAYRICGLPLGTTMIVDREEDMHKGTGLCASSPSYIWTIMHLMAGNLKAETAEHAEEKMVGIFSNAIQKVNEASAVKTKIGRAFQAAIEGAVRRSEEMDLASRTKQDPSLLAPLLPMETFSSFFENLDESAMAAIVQDCYTGHLALAQQYFPDKDVRDLIRQTWQGVLKLTVHEATLQVVGKNGRDIAGLRNSVISNQGTTWGGHKAFEQYLLQQ